MNDDAAARAGSSGDAERADPTHGNSAMGAKQRHAMRRAVRLEWITLAWITGTVVLVGSVAGQSQAMRAAWAEDALSLLPPLAFLIASRRIRKPADRLHPYGFHRSIGVAHLVAAVALLGMGSYLAISSAMGLLMVERPPVGLVVIFGRPIWSGWLMIAAMIVTSIGPVILGRMKLGLAEELHDKVLRADADMNKADWSSASATIVGVLGIGVGWWWADSAAAIVVSVSIVRDGMTNLIAAIGDLTDTEARTVDGSEPHPLTLEVEERALARPWIDRARARVRDEGHLFHAELFLVPLAGQMPTMDQLSELHEELEDLDWKMHDVVVVPVADLPPDQTFRSTLRD